jgi:branched-chain amino acid transport system ATP-binding protein
MALLEVKDLIVRYGGIEALHGISFEIEEGEIVTLIGANGAGKSTTLKAIMGSVAAAQGSITYTGQDILAIETRKIVGLGAVLVPEGRKIFPNLTVLENLKVGAYLRKDSLEADIDHIYDLFPRLKERNWQMAGTLSGGEQQMLAVGRALMAKPRLLMMDEPSLGLAPLIVKDIFEIIKVINSEGVTVLLIEQNANAALHVANRGYVMETGLITVTDTCDKLLADERIRQAYLGTHK